MILSSVCIFLTLYLYYRFTEIQHSNLDTQNKVIELQGQIEEMKQRLEAALSEQHSSAPEQEVEDTDDGSSKENSISLEE